MRCAHIRCVTGPVSHASQRESTLFVGSVFSLMQTVEFVHRGCRLCEADEDHTNEQRKVGIIRCQNAQRDAASGSRPSMRAHSSATWSSASRGDWQAAPGLAPRGGAAVADPVAVHVQPGAAVELEPASASQARTVSMMTPGRRRAGPAPGRGMRRATDSEASGELTRPGRRRPCSSNRTRLPSAGCRPHRPTGPGAARWRRIEIRVRLADADPLPRDGRELRAQPLDVKPWTKGHQALVQLRVHRQAETTSWRGAAPRPGQRLLAGAGHSAATTRQNVPCCGKLAAPRTHSRAPSPSLAVEEAVSRAERSWLSWRARSALPVVRSAAGSARSSPRRPQMSGGAAQAGLSCASWSACFTSSSQTSPAGRSEGLQHGWTADA